MTSENFNNNERFTVPDAPELPIILSIAGRPVDGKKMVRQYPRKTLARFDLLGPGNSDVLTREEVTRTQSIHSRIDAQEVKWFVERAENAPWMQADAVLVDADPSKNDGIYKRMDDLYRHFREPSRRGVNAAKVSKVLHVKRPGLYPILDSQLLKVYRVAATEQARQFPELGAKRLYWAAIRADVLTNASGLVELREWLAVGDEQLQPMSLVSDVRLLDICTWRSPSAADKPAVSA